MSNNTLAQLREGEEARVTALNGGHAFQRRLQSLGLKEGQTICLVAKHPLGGPLVIKLQRRQITMGRGLAQRVVVARKP